MRAICPNCKRKVLVDDSGFLAVHLEPESKQICYMTGTWAEELCDSSNVKTQN
jgi:hypothetical protein